MCKREIYGNSIVRENQNPILDTRQYELEFSDGEVMNLTNNVVSERIYTQCDKDLNDILLINYFVDYRKTERALLLQDQ